MATQTGPVLDARTPLDLADLLGHLEAVSERDPDLAAILDHIVISLDAIATFAAKADGLVDGLAAFGEQMAEAGPLGMVGALMGGGGGMLGGALDLDTIPRSD